MNHLSSIVPLFAITAFCGAFLISIIYFSLKRVKYLPDIIGCLTTAVLLSLAIKALIMVNTTGALFYNVGAWKPPMGIGLTIDGLSAFMLLIVNLIVFLISLYSVIYMERYTDKAKFYTLFLLMIGGMNGVLITGDIFNLFVFLEIASLASYVLVAFGTEKHELEAAFKYAVMSAIGSIFIFLGIAFLYSYTSTLNIADMASQISQKGPNNICLLVAVLFLMGFGLKSALVPFHGWLPDAHSSAPAPVSATLSGVLIKSLGVYTLCRLFYGLLGVNPKIAQIFLVLSVVSMFIGVFLALGQTDLKRLLAYSSISQIGYIFMGIFIGTPLSIAAGLFHLFNHSVFKSLLFLNSGSLEYSLGTRDLNKMGGLAKKMPITATTSFIGSMSISGIPPFSGFWSKLLIIIAAIQAHRFGLAVCAALVSIFTLALFAKVLKQVFFDQPTQNLEKVKESPWLMTVPMIILAVLALLSGGLFLNSTGKNVVFGAANSLLAQQTVQGQINQ